MKKMSPLIIAILSAILAIYAAYWQYSEKETERIEKDIQKKRAEENELKANKFQDALLSKTESLDSANIEIRNLQNQLLDKTAELLSESQNVKNVQQETIKFMTGDGVPILNFFSKGKGIFSPIFYNRTNYPIYDMRIRIDDFDQVLKCQTKMEGNMVLIERECMLKISKRSGPIFMAPGQNQPIEFDLSGSGVIRHFLIECITRKDIFTYLCIIKLTSSKVEYCIRLYHNENGKSIFIEEKEYGLQAPADKYWIDLLYAGKILYSGPMDDNQQN